jgi:hypothetical protein
MPPLLPAVAGLPALLEGDPAWPTPGAPATGFDVVGLSLPQAARVAQPTSDTNETPRTIEEQRLKGLVT